MKKWKKFLLVFLATLSVLCGALGLVGCDQTKPVASSEGLKYRLLDDGTYHVSGIGSCKDTEIVIPATYLGKAVTGIRLKAFADCSNLTSVVIPDSVTKITLFAFAGCSNLTSVILGDSVTTISDKAFYNCSKLRFNEYDECKYLGTKNNPYFALIEASNTDYSNYTIHEDTKMIATSAFSGCASMASIVVPDSVTTIGSYVFYHCYNLTSVVIGDSVTTIGYDAFYDCSNLTSVYYKGTASDWSNISIDGGNSKLTNATRYYYSEEAPTEEGNWWRYDQNGEVVVW